MDTSSIFAWLLSVQPRLLRVCEQQARTRPGLEGEELAQAAFVLFVERAPRWFAQVAQVSVEAQAWTLLKTCVRNLVTDHDRAVARTAVERAEADEEGWTLLERQADPNPDAPARLVERESSAALVHALEDVENPTYKLVLYAVYAPGRLTAGHFEAAAARRAGGAEAFARPWPEVAKRVMDAADEDIARSSAPADRVAWRRFLAACFREAGDPKTTTPSAQARGWLDRNLSRARVALGVGEEEP